MLTPEAALFFTVAAFLLILVPAEAYPRLFPPSFVLGLLGPLAATLIASGLGIKISRTIFTVSHFDIWFLYGWIPLFMLYLYHQPKRGTWHFWVYVLAFTVFSTCNWVAFQNAHRLATGLRWYAAFPVHLLGYVAVSYLSPYLTPDRPTPRQKP